MTDAPPPPQSPPAARPTSGSVTDLFRKEVFANQGRRLSGEVILASPPSGHWLTALLVGAVIVGVAFATLASYARRETVQGWVVPDTGLIRLVAREGGVVESVSVQEGQRVQAGQVIAIVRRASELEGRDAVAELAGSVEAQTQAAGLRASAAQAVLEAEARRLEQRVAALREQTGQLDARVSAQESRVALAGEEVRRAEQVAAQGFLTRRELDTRRAAALNDDIVLGELRTDRLRLEDEISGLQARLHTIPIDLQAARADAAAASAVLSGERVRTDSQGAYAITATVDGIVAALPARFGQAVEDGATLAVITPGGGQLGVDLYVPSRAAGFVDAGQEVRLMYQAFPHQKFGTGGGRVVSVSGTVLAPRDVDAPGMLFTEPVYRVRVALEADIVNAYGREAPLRPGMLLSADIVVDRRSLLEWLLDPLYAAGRR